MRERFRRYFKFGVIGGLLLASLYGVVAYRYWNNPPKVTRNYVAEMNDFVPKVADDQKGWPIYREALLAMADDRPRMWREHSGEFERVVHDPSVVAYLRRIEPQLKRVRAATKLPAFGYELSDPPSADDRRVDERHVGEAMSSAPLQPVEHPASDKPMLFLLMTYSASPVQELAQCLAAHALLAAKQGDAASATDDLESLLRLADQFREVPHILNELVAFGAYNVGLRTWMTLIYDKPDLFTSEQLARLEHAARGFCNGDIKIRMTGVRLEIDDVVQRLFTDDGNGDGYGFAPAAQELGGGEPLGRLDRFLAPIGSMSWWSRRRVRKAIDQYFELLARDASRPNWEPRESDVWDRLKQLESTPETKLVGNMLWPTSQLQKGERDCLQIRDAALTASALVRYRAAHGDWPATLGLIVPDYISAILLDQMSGKSIGYVLMKDDDGRRRPRLYSNGSDRDDDGGRAGLVTDPDGGEEKVDDHIGSPLAGDAKEGDLILWPPVRKVAPLKADSDSDFDDVDR